MDSQNYLWGPIALSILNLKYRLTPIPNAGVNLYLEMSTVGATGPKLCLYHCYEVTFMCFGSDDGPAEWQVMRLKELARHVSVDVEQSVPDDEQNPFEL